MKIFENIKTGEHAELIEKNGNDMTIKLESGEIKSINRITLCRWWKEIEQPEIKTPENVTPEQPEIKTPENITPEQPEIKTPENVTPEQPTGEKPITTDKSDPESPMKMSELISKLESLFVILNRIYFEDKLPKPVITVQSTPKAYGRCTTKKIWASESEGQYEINIGAEYVNRPSAETAATMCHEMVHLYCIINGIEDTCQKGRYHNKTFKEEAEKRDLHIEYNRTIGYSITSPTDEFKSKLTEAGFELDVKFARQIIQGVNRTSRARAKQHKYVCPICGQTVKSTAELNLICGDCEVPMERID